MTPFVYGDLMRVRMCRRSGSLSGEQRPEVFPAVARPVVGHYGDGCRCAADDVVLLIEDVHFAAVAP